MKAIRHLLTSMACTGGLIISLHLLHAQETATPIQSTAPDSIIQLTADSIGLPLISPDALPRTGTFFLMVPGPNGIQAQPYPCPPGGSLPTYSILANVYLVDGTAGQVMLNSRFGANTTVNSALAAQAAGVANLVEQIQGTAALASLQTTGGMTPMDSDGGGMYPNGSTNIVTPAFNFDYDYGTNLWIAQARLTNIYFSGIISNSAADIEYELQYTTDLTQPWQSAGWFALGSETTNWTPFSVPGAGPTNFFLSIRSWIDSQNVGIPDWWQLQYFGYVGVNPYSDPAGDGWTLLQKYINGWNPTNFYTPPTVQGFYANSSGSGNDVLNWIPPEVTPDGFTIQENTGSGWQTIATVAGSINSLTVTNPPANASFQISANYPSGSSAYIAAGSPSTINPLLTLPATVASGTNGRLFLLTATPSVTVTGLMLIASPANDYFPKDGIYSVASQFPRTNFTTRNYAVGSILPASSLQASPLKISTNFAPIYGWYNFSLQALGTNGTSGNVVQPVWWADGTPFLDGRQHLLDNLNFALRAASASQSFDFYFPANPYISAGMCYGIFPNYTTAGFSWAFANNDEVLHRSDILDPFLPFENDSVLRAFCFDTNRFDAYGNPLDVSYGGYFSSLPEMNTWNYYFNALAYVQSGSTNLPARQLDPITTQYIFYGPASDGQNVSGLGMTWDSTIPGWRVGNNPRNVYGLRIQSVICVKSSQTLIPLTYYSAGPGGIIPEMGTTNNPGSGWLYFQVENPGYQKTGFHFVPQAYASETLTGPGWFVWTGVPNTNSLLASVGTQSFFYLWTQLTATNANSGTVSYLEDYFDRAYAIDTNGVVTTNQTGVLSEYGNFFPTAPGPVALVTKPELATGQSCTGIVQVISLAVDANHDCTVEPTFYGSDYTTSDHPYVFWVNNNFDRFTLDADDNAHYDDDVKDAGCPYTPNISTPDRNYLDGAGHRVIPCERDLQDFARLWVCGVNSNLLAALPPGGTVTLSWSSMYGNPTIDLFVAADSDGGLGYLTNSSTAFTQTDPLSCPYVGRISPGHGVQLNTAQFSSWAGNHFIWCGVTNGSGALNLTVNDGSGNALVQSTVYIQLVDIKQMYERWTVGEQPNYSVGSVPVPAADGLPQPFTYSIPAPAGTPYILFVHGWNMETWEKDRFAESAFKRLYWQGYQGRFGEFRWPTTYGFAGSFWQALTDTENFDKGEFNAWQSAAGLLNKLNNLNSQYPGHIYVLAHSMGNDVAGEALRLAAQNGNGQIINTYVASQAAISAHNYDATVTTPYLLPFTYKYPSGPLGLLGTNNYGPYAPDIYVNRLTNNVVAVGKRINFYNQNDFALEMPRWGFDQITKPDHPVGGYYHYSGSISDPSPWNNFEFIFTTGDPPPSPTYFDIVNSLHDRHEVMAYAAPSYSTALGATPNVLNISQNLDLTTVWPTDTSGHDYADHFWHSAEFRGDYWQQQGYWHTLLFSSTYGFNISP